VNLTGRWTVRGRRHTLSTVPTRSPLFQVCLILAVVALYVTMGLLDLPPVIILVLAATGGVAIILHQVLVIRVRPADLGLRIDNLRRAAIPAAIATAAFAAAAVAWVLAADRPLWSDELAWMLPLYPLWGLAQQTLFQGILHRNLRKLVPAPAAVLVTAIAFALVHWGRPELVGLTAVAGLVWSMLFTRCPNVIVLEFQVCISTRFCRKQCSIGSFVARDLQRGR